MDKIPITADQLEVLNELGGSELDNWTSRLEALHISKNHISLKGTEQNVEAVRQELKTFVGSIATRTGLLVRTPGALSCVQSDAVKSLCSDKEVVLQVDKENSTSYSRVSSLKESFTLGNVTILVHQDKISKVNSDAIICPATSDLKLQGEVGQYILEDGGLEIEEECTRQVNRNGPVAVGGVYLSKTGNLSDCSHIIHAVGSANDSEMSSLLKQCLKEAHDLKVIIRMAIPLSFDYPVDKLTTVLWNVVDEYLRNSSGVTLREIRIVDMNARRLYECIRRLKALSADGAKRPFVYNERDKILTTEEGMRIELLKGCIADVKPPVDVIVNSAPPNVQLDKTTPDTISHSLFAKGGAMLQEEINRKAPHGIREPGEIVNSEAPNIPSSRCCYHVMLLGYDGKPDGQSVKVLRAAVKNALATTQRENHSSIAIPAIGGGVLKIPKQIVVDALLEEVNIFSQQNPKSSVKRVVLVAYHKDKQAVKTFEEKFDQLKKSAKKTPPKYTFHPQDYELLLNIHALSEDRLRAAENELMSLFRDALATDEIRRIDETCHDVLDNIDNDKARALQSLQFTHRVRITLKYSSDRLDSILIEGFLDDVQQAKLDALRILS